MNWRWTWVNFLVSLLINRLRFLIDEGLSVPTPLEQTLKKSVSPTHLLLEVRWGTCLTLTWHPGTSTSMPAPCLLCQYSPCFTQDHSPMPGVVHVLQDDQVVPLDFLASRCSLCGIISQLSNTEPVLTSIDSEIISE